MTLKRPSAPRISIDRRFIRATAVLCLVSVGFVGCGSRKLDRATALALLQKQEAALLAGEGPLFWVMGQCEVWSLDDPAFAAHVAPYRSNWDAKIEAEKAELRFRNELQRVGVLVAGEVDGTSKANRTIYNYRAKTSELVSEDLRGLVPVINVRLGRGTFLTVTGIRPEGQDEAVVNADFEVQPTEIWQKIEPIVAELRSKSYAGRHSWEIWPQKGEIAKKGTAVILFRRYDDGWRIESRAQ